MIPRFVDLGPSGVRTSTRRIPDEHRLFFWQGELVAHARYHDVGDPLRDIAPYRLLGERIDSPFFPADIAFRNSAERDWVAVEINNGGVLGLPRQLDPRELYEAMIR